MINQPLDEGDLLAYIAGEAPPHVANAIAHSPELQREVATLRHAEAALLKQFGGIERPTTQDTIDVLLDQASQAQIIRVQRYVRQSAQGRATYEQLRHMAGIADPEEDRAAPIRTGWVRHIALPPVPIGTRSSEDPSARPSQIRAHPTRPNTGMFAVDELEIQILVQIFPPEKGKWIVQGYVTRAMSPVSSVLVAIHHGQHDPITTATDEQGMFLFQHLLSGSYRLEAQIGDDLIEVSEIILEGA